MNAAKKNYCICLVVIVIIGHVYFTDAMIEYAKDNGVNEKLKVMEITHKFDLAILKILKICGLQITTDNERDLVIATIYFKLADSKRKPWVLFAYLYIKFRILLYAKLFLEGPSLFQYKGSLRLNNQKKLHCALLAEYLLKFGEQIPTEPIIKELHKDLAYFTDDSKTSSSFNIHSLLEEIRVKFKIFQRNLLADVYTNNRYSALKEIIASRGSEPIRIVNTASAIRAQQYLTLMFTRLLFYPDTQIIGKDFTEIDSNFGLLQDAEGHLKNVAVESSDETGIMNVLRSLEVVRIRPVPTRQSGDWLEWVKQFSKVNKFILDATLEDDKHKLIFVNRAANMEKSG